MAVVSILSMGKIGADDNIFSKKRFLGLFHGAIR
jgi:hypothetical protein